MPGKSLWQRQPTIGRFSGMPVVQCVSAVPPYIMFSHNGTVGYGVDLLHPG